MTQRRPPLIESITKDRVAVLAMRHGKSFMTSIK